ncbi:glycoside hydrolase family 32 protein [Acetobacteraceae bacterium]|nr:glycoside hydrolase family 32 protein [Acetobacteraceae bacterium]
MKKTSHIKSLPPPLNRRQALNRLTISGVASFGFLSYTQKISAAILQPNDETVPDPTETNTDAHRWRPNLHFTASKGFMNDPCGLIFDGKFYHLYYQFNPKSPQAGEPSWGHAISEDLYHWKDCPIAIAADKTGMIFTGSAVIDEKNSSGLFKDSPQKNLVVFYTKATEKSQSQWLAWSSDGGLHYQNYAKNPVVDAGHNSFRDPKVFWHEPSKKWIMTVVEASKKRVSLYGSYDLISWMHLSNFGPSGLFGTEWECPNLVELEIENETNPDGSPKTCWVFFVSINPGAPLGGSSTQYFLGQFDGERFTRKSAGVGVVDFAKDNYALQFYNHFPNHEKVYLGWFGNWQYCEELPTKEWNGAMTLPRKATLRRNADKFLSLIQKPLGLEALREAKIDIQFPESQKNTWLLSALKRRQLKPYENFHATLPNETAVEFLMDVVVEERGVRNPDGASGRAGRVIIELTNALAEKLSLGFDAASCQFWVDRSELRGFHHPFFTGSFSVALPKDSQQFSLRLILDGCTLEVYINDGEDVGTFLLYPYHPLTTLTIGATNATLTLDKLELYRLKRTMNRPHFSSP